MTYDNWKTTNPADAYLGDEFDCEIEPEPDYDEREPAMIFHLLEATLIAACLALTVAAFVVVLAP